MKTPTGQPDADLVELNVKVVELAKMAQIRKEELSRRQEEEGVVVKKTQEDKQLRDLFADGGKIAELMLKNIDNINFRNHGTPIKILQFGENCGNIEAYIDFLKIVFNKLRDQFEGGKKVICDPKRGVRIVSVHPKCRVFPGSGTVINDCCGGVNGHEQYCGYTNLQEYPLSADELEVLKKEQGEEMEELTGQILYSVKSIHAHMEGFIETILKSNPDTDALLDAVKVAMVAGVDTFYEFGGRQKVLRQLRDTVIAKIEEKLSTDSDIDEEGIKEIERILNEVGEAVKQQVKK